MARKKSQKKRTKASKKTKKKSSKKQSSKKSTKKKGSQKKSTQKKPVRPSIVGWVALVLILIIAALSWLAYQDMQDRGTHSSEEIIASVNGVPITQGSLDFQYGLLPPEYRAQLSKEDVLEEVIDEELIVQDARKKGVVVTPEDINERVQALLQQGGLTVADLQLNLAQFNMTMDEFEILVERQIIIARFTEEFVQVEDPTEEEIQGLYELNLDAYMTPEQVRVRHVLIASQRDDAAELSKEVYDAAREGADFCGLVNNYTDDVGSKEACGEYTFPRGFMVPEFEEASFTLAPGEFEMVQTQFGYHIIEKLEDIPEGVTPLEDVKDQLRAELKQAKYVQEYKRITSSLRREATIVYGDEEGEDPFDGSDLAEEVDESLDEAVEEVESLADDIAEELDEVVEEVVPVDLQDDVEDAPIDEDPAPEEAVAAHVQIDNIHACIADRTILYGMPWSSETRESREMFEGYDLTYVDCSEEACGGVSAYPSWGIGDEIVIGKLSLDDLQRLTDC